MTYSQGAYPRIDRDMCKTLREITRRGYDAEVRMKRDGSYDVFMVQKKRFPSRWQPSGLQDDLSEEPMYDASDDPGAA